MTWTTWALPAILCGLVAWGAVIVLMRTMPERALNRRLAVVLFLEGAWMGAGGLFYMVEAPSLFVAIAAVAVAAMAALPFQYLSFLSVSVDTPLVRFFRSRTAFIVLALGSTGLALAVILSPQTFIGEIYSPPWATSNFLFTPNGQRLALLHGVASLFGLLAAVDAFRRARRGTAARERAKWFAIAFGIRDAYVGISLVLYPVVRDIGLWADFIYNPGTAIIYVIYVVLMAYGVLNTQLFDLDLRLKFALKQSTVGAVFAGAFFTGSELLERIVPVEGTFLGLGVAGTIVLVLRPVQRFAEVLAGSVMRGVKDTPDYVETRKYDVYSATLEGVLEDGAITARERKILNRLREQLEIPTDVADRLEREMAPTWQQAS